MGLLAPGQTPSEDEASNPAMNPRGALEPLALAAAARSVRASFVRLPPTVHGAGDHGFVPMLIDTARQKGFAAYVGDGANRWPAVHRLDAARLYRLALETAPSGTRLHAVAEEGVTMLDIARAIGEGLGLPARGITPEAAAGHFGWMAKFVAMDAPASSGLTRERFPWQPEEVGLLADMRENGYFE
jgi:nucleoside-diphosphate-sugar epimerase